MIDEALNSKVFSGLCFKITQFRKQGYTDEWIAAYLEAVLPRSYYGQPWTARAVRKFARRHGLPVPVSPLPTPNTTATVPPVKKLPRKENQQ